jgi:hypothetical protein
VRELTPRTDTSTTVTTDAGMLAQWDAERFRSIIDYDSWERELSMSRAGGV